MIANPKFPPSSLTPMAVEAYLEWESCQELRYEYVNGELVAMTGGTLPHNDIAINLLAALRPHVRSRGCRINMADAKVNITPTLYRYPDLAVSCDERDKIALDALRYPCLLVEVLSPGTEANDRGDKFRDYRTLPSLLEYVLIDAQTMSVEIYRRGEGHLWFYTADQAGDRLPLKSIDYELPIELLYEDIIFDETNRD